MPLLASDSNIVSNTSRHSYCGCCVLSFQTLVLNGPNGYVLHRWCSRLFYRGPTVGQGPGPPQRGVNFDAVPRLTMFGQDIRVVRHQLLDVPRSWKFLNVISSKLFRL